MSDLPSGWMKVPLGKVATTQLGRMLSARRETGVHAKPYLRNRDVQWHYINTENLPVMDFNPKESARFLLQPGDILVCEGGEVGRAAIWDGQLAECYYQKALHRVRPSQELLPKFLVYLLEYYSRTRAFEQYTSGSTIAHLPQEDLRELPIPLPPLAEQERSVEVIEEHFSRLDSGIEALGRAMRSLKQMRTVMLNSAVTDALESSGGKMTPLADLLAARLANGKSVPDGPSDGFPVLRLTAVRDDRIDVNCFKRGSWTVAEASPYLIQKGDYLVVRGNGSKRLVGRGGLVEADARVAYPDTLIRIRFDATAIYPEYAAALWNSEIIRRQIEAAARTTAGIYKINQKDLGRLEIPVPALSDQERIYSLLDASLSRILKLEATVSTQLRRTDRLRSSILAAVFSGKFTAKYFAGVSA